MLKHVLFLIPGLSSHGDMHDMPMPIQHVKYAYCHTEPSEELFLQKPPENEVDNYQTLPEYDFPGRDISYSPTCNSEAFTFEKSVPNSIEQHTEMIEMYHMMENEEVYNFPEDIPSNGPHKAMWAAFGEYNYLPPTRYLHNLEHGALIFLYHPCIEKHALVFKSMARNCLWKHLISKWETGLSQEYPFAIVAWGHLLKVGDIRKPEVVEKIVNFVKEHSWKGEKGHCWGNGGYKTQLIRDARLVSDMVDSEICPWHGI